MTINVWKYLCESVRRRERVRGRERLGSVSTMVERETEREMRWNGKWRPLVQSLILTRDSPELEEYPRRVVGARVPLSRVLFEVRPVRRL